MQKFYKYGLIGLSLAVLAFIGLVAVQDVPTMALEEKLKAAETVAAIQELRQLRIEADLQRRRTEAAVEKSRSLNGQAAIDYMPVLKANAEKSEDLIIRMEAAKERARQLGLELERSSGS